MDNGGGVPPQVSQGQACELPAVELLRRRAVLGLRRRDSGPREEPAPPTGGACGRPGWHDGSGERRKINVGKITDTLRMYDTSSFSCVNYQVPFSMSYQGSSVEDLVALFQ